MNWAALNWFGWLFSLLSPVLVEWQAGNQATTGAGGMSVSGPSRVRHLFALSRWILQGFNPIYEFRFSFLAKQNIWFCFAVDHALLCASFFMRRKKPATGRTRHQIAETSRRAVSGMRQVASGKCQCEWQDSVGSALRSEWQRQVQRVALYYAYSQGNNNNNNNSRRNSNRPRSGASSSNLACHLNELNKELINHAHISHSYATKQLAATNQSPSTEQDPEPGHSFTRPSEPRTIHQSINQ